MPEAHRVASLLKRWLLGTHQGGVSHEQLDYYLDEFTFRFNRRRSRHRGLLFYRLRRGAPAGRFTALAFGSLRFAAGGSVSVDQRHQVLHSRPRGSVIPASWASHVTLAERGITVRPDQMGGVPCVRGLRISVATVVGMVADGMSESEILVAYPDLEAEDVREAIRYAAEAVRERELPLAASG